MGIVLLFLFFGFNLSEWSNPTCSSKIIPVSPVSPVYNIPSMGLVPRRRKNCCTLQYQVHGRNLSQVLQKHPPCNCELMVTRLVGRLLFITIVSLLHASLPSTEVLGAIFSSDDAQWHGYTRTFTRTTQFPKWCQIGRNNLKFAHVEKEHDTQMWRKIQDKCIQQP